MFRSADSFLFQNILTPALRQHIYIYFLPKPKNWVGLTVVNVRAVKNEVNAVSSCKIRLRFYNSIKTKIF